MPAQMPPGCFSVGTHGGDAAEATESQRSAHAAPRSAKHGEGAA